MSNLLKQAFSVKGYDQLDLLEINSTGRDYSYSHGLGYSIQRSEDFGIGVRAVVNGKVGHAYANRYEDLLNAVKNAIKFAKYSDIMINLEKNTSFSAPKKRYDSKLVNKSDEEVLSQIKNAICFVSEEKCNMLNMDSAISESKVRYMNSEGTDESEKSTGFEIAWALSHKDNQIEGSNESTGVIKNFNKELEYPCELARLMDKKVEVKTRSMPVVFYSKIFADLLSKTFSLSISSKNVQQNKSKLAGKIGDEVFSKKLSIIDDGLFYGGLSSGSFDAEGVPQQKTMLIDKGVLRAFLYDLARANKEGVKSTGNGNRGYSSAATVSPTNLVLPLGKKNLISEVDNGIFVENAMNTHSIEFSSGDFSIGGGHSFLIKNGELVGKINNMLLSGNFYDVLKKIKELGKDRIMSATDGGTIITPSILSECLVISE